MSSSKRRKLESQETPTSAVSAVSALAARRRLAAGSAVADNSASSSTKDATLSKQTNPFSLLQTLKPHGDSQNTPSKPPARASRGPQARTGPKRASTGDNTEAPKIKGLEDSTTGDVYSNVAQYSSFRLTKHNHRHKSDDIVELRLENSERFLVLGSFGIRIISGEVTVAGATLRPSDTIHWIHAPLCHAIPVLRTIEHSHLELHKDPIAYDLRKLDRLSPLFRRIWNEPPDGDGGRKPRRSPTFKILCTSEDAPKRGVIQELVSPPEWNKKLASLMSLAAKRDPFSALVSGPKSAGKSTFSKLLTNRLLTGEISSQRSLKGVAVLDLDPGQPEYAPSGTLSLVHAMRPNLGTPFTHAGLDEASNRVVRCHALASVSPAAAPDFYLECALDLFDTYQNTMNGCPLVINTPGWILGTGLDLLVEVIARASPQEVLYMSEDGPADTVETLREATANSFTALPSQQSEFTSRTAAHLRAMQTMSYFHTKERESHDPPARQSWFSSPLSTIVPWQVRYSGPKSGFLGILSYDDQSPLDWLSDTINGMVLAAVEIEDSRAFREMVGRKSADKATDVEMGTGGGDDASLSVTVSRTPEGLPFIPNSNDVALDPRYARTVGLVLIRGIDVETQSLQVITPIPQHRIEEIKSLERDIVLVHGKFDAPNWAYTEDLYERSGQEEGSEKEGLELIDEDTSEDDSGIEPEHVEQARDVTAMPWVEILKKNEKRPVGSRVWRVRRDLGRGAGD